MSASEEPASGRADRPDRPERTGWPREEYGPVRAWFKLRADRFENLQGALDAAGRAVPFDAYLAGVARVAVAAGTVALVATGVVVALAAPTDLAGPAGGAVTLVVALGAGVATGGTVGALGYAYPFLVARRRGRRIDAGLPHATLFLFALVHGGVSLYPVIRELGDAEEAYGDVAVEFDRLVADAERFGDDLLTAIDRAAARTPSADLGDFLEEWGYVLEMGGDVHEFLETRVASQLDRAEAAQEQFLEDVETLAEVYVVVAFVGPILVFIALSVVSFSESAALAGLEVLVYLYLPLGTLVFGWWFDRLARPLQPSAEQVRFDRGRTIEPASTLGGEADADGRGWRAWRRLLRHRRVRDVLRTVGPHVLRRPLLVAAASVPLAVAAVAALVVTGRVPVGVDAIRTAPVPATTGLLVVPFVVATVPVAVVHELNRRRRRRIRQRLPTALRIVADANRNGVPLGECFGTVATRTSEPLSGAFDRVHRDIEWFDDVGAALRTFSERLAVPAVSRVTYLLTATLRSTNDVAPVVDVVADDLQARNDLHTSRHEHARTYVVVIVLGVLVFLAIVALFDLSYLPALERLSSAELATTERMPIRVRSLSIARYHRLLFHAAVVQAVGNGLLLGKIADDDLWSGLKYANALVVVVVAVFLALP